MSAAPKIPIAGPWITDHEVAAVTEAARSSWYGDAGRHVHEFEDRFANYVGRRFGIALPSATAGIHLSLLALGVGPGDEVVVPDATWIASAAPISYVGAVPRFVDVDPESWCVDPVEVAAAMSKRTRAVIAVDLYGGMPDMHELARVCDEHGVAVVEDAAEAIGSRYRGRRAGGFGVTSVFSFHGSKTLTTGEGGMVVTDDEALAGRMRLFADHGRRPDDTAFYNQVVAHKYKMSAVQAALGLAQLDRVDELVAKKRQIFGWYRQLLGNRADLLLNREPVGVENSYWMTTAVLDDRGGLTERSLAAMLDEEGIATRPFFHPLSSLPAYSSMPGIAEVRNRNVVSARLGTYGINLPSALSLDEDLVAQVCAELVRVIDGARHRPARSPAPSAGTA